MMNKIIISIIVGLICMLTFWLGVWYGRDWEKGVWNIKKKYYDKRIERMSGKK